MLRIIIRIIRRNKKVKQKMVKENRKNIILVINSKKSNDKRAAALMNRQNAYAYLNKVQIIQLQKLLTFNL